jgi:hypothetical protein
MPRRPTLTDLWRALERVADRLQTALAIPRIPRQVRVHLETLQAEVTALLERNGRR